MRECQIILQDEVNCKVMGLHESHREKLSNEFSEYAPNHFFHPKYKMGVWDGKIRFFAKDGTCYINMLEDVIPRLVKYGYKPILNDKRIHSEQVELEPIDENYFCYCEIDGNPIILREYQVRAVNALLKSNGGILVASTAAGKTFINAAVAKRYGEKGLRTMTIVPSRDLIKQTKQDFVLVGLDCGEFSGKVKNTENQHIVSTWQSLKNQPQLMHDFHVVIVDETHKAKANVIKQLLMEHGKHIQYRFGLTGTMPKEPADQLTIKSALGEIVETISAKELIDKNYLASLEINIHEMQEDCDKEYEQFISQTGKKLTKRQFKDSLFGDYQQEKRYLNTNTDRIKWIANFIEEKQNSGKGNVLCLVENINFGESIANMLDNGYFICGKDDNDIRQQVYKLFEENDDVAVIATFGIASTGINIKRIFNLVYCDGGKSFIKILQSIGRGLRKAEDKHEIAVHDICSDLKYSRRHTSKRKDFYKESHYPFKVNKVKY